MSNITTYQLESDLAQRLELLAAEHGRTIDAEIKSILELALASKTKTELNLAEAIEQHFRDLGGFNLPEITREAMRPIPTFEA